MVNKIGVYALHNPDTGEQYIGSGVLNKRRFSHFNELKNNKHSNYKLQRAYNKNSNFEFIGIPLEDPELLRETNRELTLKIEQELINKELNNPLLLNIALNTLAPRFGTKASDETKNKMSLTKLGKKASEETKAKMSLAQKGKIVSEETREKQSKKALEQFTNGERKAPWLGKKLSEEHVDKMKISLKNTWDLLSEEEKKNRTETMISKLKGNTYTLGRKLSEEQKSYHSLVTKGMKRSEESKENISNGIRQSNGINFTVNGKIYNCYSQAALDNNINVQTVINRINSYTDKFKEWCKHD